jgi:hypothetical protein
MSALLPDAATSFTFVEEKGKVAARIENSVLPDLNARRKFLLARVPQAVEMSLSDLLQMSQKKLQTKLKDSALIMVRSLEIDSLGEQENTFLARQVMDTAIGNVARAVRKLAAQGVAHIIITADHGHLFALERGDDMKTDNPGSGLEPHRRCWIGRGGSTPAGAIRVSGAELGYATDLDVIFPTGLGIFKAGGGLTYHHGGTSLQEMVIPVLTLRIPQRVVDQAPGVQVIVEYAAATLHNRTLSVRLTLAGNLFTEATTIRPVLLAGSEQVGQAGMAMGGEFDSSTGCVTLQPGQPADVGMLLTRYDPPSIRIVVQDPATDAVLGQTGDIPVELGM